MSLMYLSKIRNIASKDVDLNDLMRPSAALDKFQDMAGAHADMIGVGYDEVYGKHNLVWVILFEQLEVVSRLPKFNEEVYVNTWPKRQYKLEFEREYEIRDMDNNLLIKGISNWVLIDATKRRIARTDSISFNGEYIDKCNYLEKQPRRLNLVCNEVIKSLEYKVLLTDLDHNGHMNNARYLDAIYNLFFDDKNKKSFKKVQIAFVHEAYYGQTIKINYFKTEDNLDAYTGYVDDQLSFELILEMEE